MYTDTFTMSYKTLVRIKVTWIREHNNKTAYMHTYTYMNSKANSERTLQSICNVIFKIIKYYISTPFRVTVLIAFNCMSIQLIQRHET